MSTMSTKGLGLVLTLATTFLPGCAWASLQLFPDTEVAVSKTWSTQAPQLVGESRLLGRPERLAPEARDWGWRFVADRRVGYTLVSQPEGKSKIIGRAVNPWFLVELAGTALCGGAMFIPYQSNPARLFDISPFLIFGFLGMAAGGGLALGDLLTGSHWETPRTWVGEDLPFQP